MNPLLGRWLQRFLALEKVRPSGPTLGCKLGKYEILELLGIGGMGVVYRARDPLLQRDVALKVIQRSIAEGDEPSKRRFLREAQAIARLSHPNIVVLYEIDLDRPTPFIAMEYLQGDDLKTCIEKQLLSSTDAKLDVLAQTALGLEHAHSHGVLHRDVKPANIMVLSSGSVKLMDFGLALISSASLSLPGHIAGTPGYMSPEQFEGQEAGPPSDVFSFGVIAYELLTGRKPFFGNTLGELAHRILSGVPNPFEAPVGLKLPEAAEALVLKCLARRPEDRFQSFSPVIEELRRLQDFGPGAGRLPEGYLLAPRSSQKPALGDFSASNLTDSEAFVDTFEAPVAEAENRMELVFRAIAPSELSEPAPGEIHVHPQAPEHRGRRDLAAFVLAHGVEALAQGPGPPKQLVVQADPTLDDMLAATFALHCLAGHKLPRGAAAFARYAAIAREGIQPGNVPIEVSLEGIFLAIRNTFGEDLTEPAVGARFAEDWARMARVILTAAEEGKDPFTVPLFAESSEFARERAFLLHDLDVYRQDVLRGERWLVRLPDGPAASSALLLRHPTSLLCKYWSRRDTEAPVGGTYLFLAVWWSSGQWVFSTDPIQRLPIRSLAEELQCAEQRKDSTRAIADPWFDGAPFGYTLVAAPRAGTLLDDAEVLGIVKGWVHAQPPGPEVPAAGSGSPDDSDSA
jgi:predicted Ser/Thr protein kinase